MKMTSRIEGFDFSITWERTHMYMYAQVNVDCTVKIKEVLIKPIG